MMHIQSFFINTAYPLVYVMGLLAFVVVAYDKHLAAFGLRRVPEFVVYILTLAMGAFGTLCGMIIFGNYTDKKLFVFGVPVVLVLQLAFVVYKIMS